MRALGAGAWREWDAGTGKAKIMPMLQGAGAVETLEEGEVRDSGADEEVVAVAAETTTREEGITTTTGADKEGEGTTAGIRAPGTKMHTAVWAGRRTRQDQSLGASTEANRQRTRAGAWSVCREWEAGFRCCSSSSHEDGFVRVAYWLVQVKLDINFVVSLFSHFAPFCVDSVAGFCVLQIFKWYCFCFMRSFSSLI